MFALIGTFVFAASLWLSLTVAARTLAGSGARILEALQGRPIANPGSCAAARVRWLSEAPRPAKRLRAAA